MAGIKVTGLDKLQKKLKDNVTMDEVKHEVQFCGVKMKDRMVADADFTQGYQTGTTKRSITLEFSDEGFSASAGPETEYSPYLEYGTRFMEAQPFVKPAYDEWSEKFKKHMKRLVK